MKNKYNIGDRFKYQNHNKTKSEIVKVVAMRGSEFVFESKFTPSMTLPMMKITDMIEKGKLKKV